jgi:hypothetical protein
VKLTKEEKAEGITMTLINSLKGHGKASPVQLMPGDEPQHLLKCMSGFWCIVDGDYVRDENNRLMVFSDRDCTVGRARYLLNFGHMEKEQEVAKLMDGWKKAVRDQLDVVEKRVTDLKSFLDDDNVFVGHFSKMDPVNVARIKKEKREVLDGLMPKYEELQRMWEEGLIADLLYAFGIKSFSNPMFKATIENAGEMKSLSNLFSRTAIDAWEGDMLLLYARIEVEKKYSFLNMVPIAHE